MQVGAGNRHLTGVIPGWHAAMRTFMQGNFNPQMLFAAGEPGVDFETYNPDSLVVRRNLLLYSEQLDVTSAWTYSAAAVTANATVAPDGTTTADKLTETAISAIHIAYQEPMGTGVAKQPNVPYVASAYFKQGERTWSEILINDYGTGGFGQKFVFFDLANGVVGTTSAGVTAAMTADANGFYRCEIRFTPTSSTFNMQCRVALADNNDTYLGVVNSGIYVWGCQVEKGTSAGAYQRVTDWNTEYLAAASTGVYAWSGMGGGAATPVTAVEQPVGLWCDRRVPWTLRTAYSWAIAVGDGSLSVSADGKTVTITGATVTTRADLQNFIAASGPGVQVMSVTLVSYTGGGSCQLWNRGAPNVLTVGSTFVSAVSINNAQTDAVQVTTSGTAVFRVEFMQHSAGNHASQGSAGSRPVLSARYNIITKTEQFSDAAWTKSNVTVATGIADPNGGVSACRVTANAALSEMYQGQGGQQNTLHYSKVWVRRVSGSGPVRLYNATGTTYTDITATLTTSWQLFQTTPTTPSGGTTPFTGISMTTINDVVEIAFPDLRSSNDWTLNQPAYQRVNTATDYDTAGFILYLKFDGIDDSLQTPSNIDFSGVDKMTVWAGVTKLSDAAGGIIAEFTTINTNNGAFTLIHSTSAGANYVAGTRGTVGTASSVLTTFTAPHSAILVLLGDNAAATAATQAIGRVNGSVPSASVGGTTSAGNYANAALYIGRRAGTSAPATMRMTSLTARGTTTPTSTAFVQAIEQYAARLAGQSFVST